VQNAGHVSSDVTNWGREKPSCAEKSVWKNDVERRNTSTNVSGGLKYLWFATSRVSTSSVRVPHEAADVNVFRRSTALFQTFFSARDDFFTSQVGHVAGNVTCILHKTLR
jgi:hypothetical protein